ncbi:hypothetical protein BZJ17_08665 [Salinivibrio sp. IB574]|nr:hypothetical protein BZJ17_08665 [Salinivibrio sp. IB574]
MQDYDLPHIIETGHKTAAISNGFKKRIKFDVGGQKRRKALKKTSTATRDQENPLQHQSV